jgi:uncharacterized membrane protein
MEIAEILQRLYESEINFAVRTFWKCGFQWELVDRANRILAAGCAKTFTEAVADIARAAVNLFPDSNFARAFANTFDLRRAPR